MRALVATLICLGLMASLGACKPAGGAGAVTADDMSLGSATAPVTVVEYASLGCPICTIWNNTVFPTFKAKYVDTGKVRYVFREFLTGDLSVASAGFLLARCAGKDRYFQVLDAVFHQEQPFLETERNAEKRDALVKVAESAGMTEAQFDACVNSDQSILALKARSDKWAGDDHIETTPTYVINGKVYNNGAMSMDDLDKAIAAAQAGAK